LLLNCHQRFGNPAALHAFHFRATKHERFRRMAGLAIIWFKE
jgi:hypothetical protein